MLRLKTLWKLARQRPAGSSTPWVSASRDSEHNTRQFVAWLHSLGLPPESDCYIITSPQWARPARWDDALAFITTYISQEDDAFVLAADFRWVLTLQHQGVARFQRTPTI